MKLRQFIAWLTCHDKAALVSAGVLNNDIAMNFLRNIKEMIPKAIGKGPERALATMYDLFAQFPSDAFEIEEEAHEIYTAYLTQTERLIRYFFDSGRTVISSEPKSYSVFVPGLEKEVEGRIDLIARDKLGKTEYITFDTVHKNVYKQKARKASNKPENAPELVLPAVALADAGAVYEVWYLKGGEDKKGEYPVYEVKDGANIAYCDFGGNIDTARKNLETIIENHPEERKCENCAYEKVCKPYAETAPAATKTETPAAAPRNIKLTPEQQAVVDFTEGALCVVAIPGSGKTKTLVSRMVSLMQKGISIANLLFVTFTNKACGEIASRVAELFGDDILEDANIKTFNGLGYDILKANEKLFGRPLRLAEESTRRTLIRKVILKTEKMQGINRAVLDGEYGLVKRMDDWIQQFEQFDCSEDRFRDKNPNIDFEGFLRIYQNYKEEFKLEGFINYDEQIRLCVDLFESYPELAEKYSMMFEYIMVDEFQDVNYDQVRLLQLLCKHGNIVAVGDDDQAIYAFRGGSNEFMLNFPQYFKGAKMAGLTKNFRSNDKIVKVADACIKHNGKRLEKELTASFSAPLKPILVNAPSKQTIVESYIRPMVASYGAKNIAVIARTNKDLSDIRTALDEAGLLSTNPKDYLRTDKSFMLIYDLLSLYIFGPAEATESFTRLYSSFVSTEKVEAQYGESFYAALVRLGVLKPIMNTVQSKQQYEQTEGLAGEFGRKILRSFELFDYTVDPGECFTEVIQLWYPDADYNTMLAGDMLAKKFEESGTSSISEMYSYIDAIVRYADKTRIMYDYGDAINLLTAHDSKGKEFSAVVVLGGDRFLDTDEEGRRVLYVALTRAKHTLVITSSGEPTNNLIFEELGDTVTCV